MVLSLLVTSPEKDLKAWLQDPEIYGSQETSLQLSGFERVFGSLDLPEGRFITGKSMMLCSTNTFSGRTYGSGMQIKIPILYNSSQVTKKGVLKKKYATKNRSKKSFPEAFVKKKKTQCHSPLT